QATRVGMPYVNQRWLGGMLTNFSTVHKRIQRLKELELIDYDDVAGSGLTKKELLVLRREKDKLLKTLGGIRDMSKVPSAVWIVDTNKEHIAVAEAKKLGIPVVAILDSNCDPDVVDFPIPGNDDAIRAVALLTRVIADAVADGLMARAGRGSAAAADEGVVATDEPLAAWEAELLAGADTPVEVPTSAAEEVAIEVAAEEPVAGSAEAEAEAAADAAIAETPDEAAAEAAAAVAAPAASDAPAATEAPAAQATATTEAVADQA
ncbi:MAG TPA: 30S ribosomal protein S2, partial [Candidatus Nanopelagicales bacterium]